MEGDFLDPFRWGVWLFIAIGAAALMGAAFWLNKRISILLKGGRAQGTVVGTEGSSGSNGKTSYRPVVEFRTPDGQVHRVVGSTGTSGRGVRTGGALTVAYDPANPQRAFLLTFVQAWLGPLCLTIFGAGFLGLGMMALAALNFDAEFDRQAGTPRDKLRSRLEAMQQEAEEEEPEETESGAQVPADLFAKPKR